jgi:hypothetical protein
MSTPVLIIFIIAILVIGAILMSGIGRSRG